MINVTGLLLSTLIESEAKPFYTIYYEGCNYYVNEVPVPEKDVYLGGGGRL